MEPHSILQMCRGRVLSELHPVTFAASNSDNIPLAHRCLGLVISHGVQTETRPAWQESASDNERLLKHVEAVQACCQPTNTPKQSLNPEPLNPKPPKTLRKTTTSSLFWHLQVCLECGSKSRIQQSAAAPSGLLVTIWGCTGFRASFGYGLRLYRQP